ncbi:MAG: class I SAM-dependent methyltransferase [Anaerolineaceae bacterium]|nr:class I SAM-dependent methyltransferase [Anaerolineaceae bacterium]
MGKERSSLQTVIDNILSNKIALNVLEAGCGSSNHLQFNNEVHLVGIDISKKQLQRNTNLNEKVLGDIQDYDFQPASFDVIVCWDVLEHLPRPEKALQNFASILKDEGIAVLKLPNVFSLKGLLTKFLPYPLHILVYRYIYGKRDVGEDDKGPFKTYLKWSVAPASIKKFAENKGLRVVYFETDDISNTNWFIKNRMAHRIYKMVKSVVKFLSLGYLTDSEFVIVLQKPIGLF